MFLVWILFFFTVIGLTEPTTVCDDTAKYPVSMKSGGLCFFEPPDENYADGFHTGTDVKDKFLIDMEKARELCKSHGAERVLAYDAWKDPTDAVTKDIFQLIDKMKVTNKPGPGPAPPLDCYHTIEMKKITHMDCEQKTDLEKNLLLVIVNKTRIVLFLDQSTIKHGLLCQQEEIPTTTTTPSSAAGASGAFTSLVTAAILLIHFW